MNEKINVGFDGTDSSIEAVMWAAHEADLRRLPLRIVSCFAMPALAGADPHGWAVGEAFVNARTEAELALREMLVTAAAVYPDVAITTDVSSDPVDAVLLDEAGSDDLVVVGASSHPGAATFWLGSTPRHLVHRRPCAIVVVRGPASRGGPERSSSGSTDRRRRSGHCTGPWTRPTCTTSPSSSYTPGRSPLTRSASIGTSLVSMRRASSRVRSRWPGSSGAQPSTPCSSNTNPPSGLLKTVHDGDHLVLGSAWPRRRTFGPLRLDRQRRPRRGRGAGDRHPRVTT